MKHAQELVNAFKKIVAVDEPCFVGVVKAVDKTTNTCDVEFNEMELGEVRLQAIIKANTKGILLYPVIDSNVIVQRLGKTGDFFITMYSEVDEVLMEVGDSSFKINGGFLIQHDGDTLKSIVVDLVNQIKLITVPTNVGPSGTPLNATALEVISTRFENLLK